MNKLQKWMTLNNRRDADVGAAVGLSRVQISRLRRDLTGASVASAKRLAKLTRIPWHNFIGTSKDRRAKKVLA